MKESNQYSEGFLDILRDIIAKDYSRSFPEKSEAEFYRKCADKSPKELIHLLMDSHRYHQQFINE